ncbi:hypothetical protein TWF696_004347 [Orbilia brochopaga]|uniref:Xylanolytic transcriptional activator regulatory domain-containing protein n=1 Tax=Orbilia brochopaga TaxID=3140254 RepID=A0AAV9V639_9PEZI
MTPPDTGPANITSISTTPENDDAGDTFAPSPSDAFNSISGHSRSHGQRSQELGSMRSASRFAGSSSGICFLRTVCDAIAKVGTSENLTSAPAVNLRFIPGEDERGGDSSGCLWHASEVANDIGVAWPSFEELVALVSSFYIQGWHFLLPFLQADLVMQSLEDVCSDRDIARLSPPAVVCVRSIISISLLDRRQTVATESMKPLPSCLVFKSLEDCNENIHALLRDNSLNSLQGMLSAQLFMVSLMELRSASRLGGWIIRMAFDLGLHRCPCRYRRSFGEAEIAVRQRMFWSIYCLDRYLCQALGLPLGIRDEDIDVCLPNHEVHMAPTERINQLGNDIRLIPLTLFSKYSGIKGRLMEISNKCITHRTPNAEQALRTVHVDILKWQNEVQDFTQTAFSEDGDDQDPAGLDSFLDLRGYSELLTPQHHLLFQIQYHELLLLMHRPALSAKSTNDMTDPVAMLTCLSSARAIISLTKRYMFRYKVADGRVEHPILWHFFLSAIWMSGLVIIFTTFERGTTLQSADRDIRAVWSVLEFLSIRLPGKPKACEVALRALFELLCRKIGFSSVEPSPAVSGRPSKRQRRTNPETSQETSEASTANGIANAAPLTSSSDTGVPVPGIAVQNDTNLPPLGTPTDSTQGQTPLDENHVLWLLDVPSLLDDQCLNFFPGQAPPLDFQATSEVNADALFNNLRMNMGNEDASSFFDDLGESFF